MPLFRRTPQELETNDICHLNGSGTTRTGQYFWVNIFELCDHEIRIQRVKMPLKNLKLVRFTRWLRRIHSKTAKMAIFRTKTGYISKTYHFGVLRPWNSDSASQKTYNTDEISHSSIKFVFWIRSEWPAPGLIGEKKKFLYLTNHFDCITNFARR